MDSVVIKQRIEIKLQSIIIVIYLFLSIIILKQTPTLHFLKKKSTWNEAFKHESIPFAQFSCFASKMKKKEKKERKEKEKKNERNTYRLESTP